MPRIFVSGFIAIVATFVISGFVFVFSSIGIKFLAREGVFPTQTTEAVVKQIVPDVSCSGNHMSSCSTDYNITLLGSDGHVYYMTYYMAWNIPYIGQSMHIRYMTTHIWPFKNSVVAAY